MTAVTDADAQSGLFREVDTNDDRGYPPDKKVQDEVALARDAVDKAVADSLGILLMSVTIIWRKKTRRCEG